MDLEKLQQALEAIPPRGIINLGRRRALIMQINKLMAEMEAQAIAEM